MACYPDSPTPAKALAVLGLLLVALSGSGCARFGYYLQAAHGELGILAAARPIPEVLSDPKTPAPLRARLRQVLAIRRFAVQTLHLPDHGNFERYAALHRRYALWNVFAAPRFSVDLIQWCFPVAGCVPYRGYFSQEAAAKFAATRQARGDDVYIAGVPTFSTLGWLADPLLSTALYRAPADTAALMFHELAHALLYVPGDPVFNESFAVTVQETGVQRWLARVGRPAAADRYRRVLAYSLGQGRLISDYRGRLGRLYRQRLPAPEALVRKQRLLRRFLRADERLGRCLGVSARFPATANNASLGALATYTRWVPAFRNVLKADHGHLRRFYAEVSRVSHWPKPRRDAWLASRLPPAPSLCTRRQDRHGARLAAGMQHAALPGAVDHRPYDQAHPLEITAIEAGNGGAAILVCDVHEGIAPGVRPLGGVGESCEYHGSYPREDPGKILFGDTP